VWTSERVGVGKSFPNVEQAVKYVSIPTIGAESVKNIICEQQQLQPI
jgi:hypothetical protein